MQAFHKLAIKRKLILIIVLTSILVLGASATAFVMYDNFIVRKTMLSDQTILGEITSKRSAVALTFNDQYNARTNLASLSLNKSLIAACMYKDSELFATFLAHTNNETLCPNTVPNLKQSRFTEKTLQTMSPIMVDNRNIGSLYLVSSLEDLKERSVNYAIAAVFFTLVIGSIGMMLMARAFSALTYPLTLLANAASIITKQQDYSVRSEKRYDDDIGQLVDTFNGMLDTIENQNSALKDSEEKLRAIINNAPDLIEIVDIYGRIKFINRPNELALEDTADSPRTIFDLIDENQVEVAKSALAKVFDTGLNTTFEAYEPKLDSWYANHLGPLKEDGVVTSALVLKRDISDLKNAHQQLEQIAFYDPLTGLPNRRLFRERLSEELDRCRSNRTRLALMFLDLDNFKRVNDTLGHDAGDKLLTTITERLLGCVRHEDVVCRLGGDEFTVLLSGLESEDPAKQIADKILQRLRQPVDIGKQTVTVTISIGITVAPDHAMSPTELMQKADIAMYRAKAKGKNTYRIYDRSMEQDGLNSIQLETELRQAIDKNEFEIYYQPQISLPDRKVIGIEALLRWEHPKRGLLQPLHFIDKAEEYGMMMSLSKLTLDSACHEIQVIGQANEALKNTKLTVNISARQFRDPKLSQFIKDILEETRFPAERLELEITESTLMIDIDDSIDTMKNLRDLGISLSIDDFGTAYASINYLKKLPVDYVKIDRSFISKIPTHKDDMEIVSAVIAMAHKLHVKVLAEGIQTPEQITFLENNGCDYAQGYIICPPLPAKALAHLYLREAKEKEEEQRTRHLRSV